MFRRMVNRGTSRASPARRRVRLAAGATKGRADKPIASGSTPERILASAERLFAEQGFDGVSMPMIAAASGITAGAIYKHFASKADLFFEVVRRAVQSVSLPAAESASDATLLPRIFATFTTERVKLMRQLAVEIHYASVKNPKVRQVLSRALDHNIEQIREGVGTLQRAGKLDPTIDAQLLACAAMVFVMGLMHMETLLPQLVGDAKWHGFVQDRVAALMGLRNLSTKGAVGGPSLRAPTVAGRAPDRA
jgi:AcrR family transcriptional regulator